MSEWHDIGAIDAVPDGEVRAFEAAGERHCVVHHEGCFYALSDLCMSLCKTRKPKKYCSFSGIQSLE
jgi:nitrite reductase/ring-hydroxylating ferredoxin subunit